jgi:hypothetical protein
MHPIELHIFTNATTSAPSTVLIENTYKSFINCFKKNLDVTVWCDPKPNIDYANEYLKNLKNIFPTVNVSSSLSDGYSKAVKNSNTDFMFMLEHDWEFNNNIKHSLDTILEIMFEDDLLHLRFNKRANVDKKFDRGIFEVNNKKMTYCVTPGLSNNPHIINRQKYIDLALPLINIREKSFGIEKELSNSNLTGSIYGPVNYPNTINHKDGRSFQI